MSAAVHLGLKEIRPKKVGARVISVTLRSAWSLLSLFLTVSLQFSAHLFPSKSLLLTCTSCFLLSLASLWIWNAFTTQVQTLHFHSAWMLNKGQLQPLRSVQGKETNWFPTRGVILILSEVLAMVYHSC